MYKYVIRRLIISLPTLIGASMVIFVLMRMVPGDVAAVILGDDATPERIAYVRQFLGLDRPIYVQYFEWLFNVVRFDLGPSMLNPSVMVVEAIKNALPLTVNLATLTLLITLVLAVPLGVLSALKQDSLTDYVARVVSIGGLAIPSFWLGILIVLVLALSFRWMPAIEWVSPLENPWENLKQMIFPSLALAYTHVAIVARMTRSCVLEVMREDYVRTARAKGLLERTVVWRHALKNALLPVVTVAGVQFSMMLSGVVVIERVFNMGGMGSYFLNSIRTYDYPAIQAIFLYSVVVTLVSNLAVDIMYGWLDPRIRYG